MRRSPHLLTALLVTGPLALATACGTPAPVPVEEPRETAGGSPGTDEPQIPSGRLASDVRPSRYALNLAIDPQREGFSGVAEIDVRLPRRMPAIYLHGRGLNVSAVTVTPAGRDTVEAQWAVADEERDLASITFTRPVGPGLVRLRVTYGATFDPGLMGIYRVESGGDNYIFTQMEPLGARRAFPCFDEPSFKTPYEITLVVPADHEAIANAPQTSSTETTANMRRVRFATTEPLPTYLVALAVGPFDVVDAPPIPASDVRSRPLPFRAVAARGQGARLAHAIEHTPAIVAALEEYFGIPYPYAKLDILAVPDFGAGAMENAGAITFRDSLLLLGDNPPVGQQRGFAFVMAHELAHQWFGNLVTMEWWDDLWLNEAFATWMETQIIAATFPEFEPEIAEMGVVLSAMEADSLASARQIRQPIESSHDIHNAFDAITYSKGNAVLAMFESWLGRDVFRAGVRRYMAAHPHGNARAEDLLSALTAEAGEDVSGPFTSFLSQPGVPLVDVEVQCTPDRTMLRIRQTRYLPVGSEAEADRTWEAPFCIRSGFDGEATRECTVLGPETFMPLPNCPDWVMPNAGGLGYYRFSLDAEALAALRQNGLSELTVRETMSYADSIESSFAAGRVSYADALAALAPLARRDERALATAPMSLIGFALDRVIEDEDEQAAARAYAARLYRTRARRLGWRVGRNESPETQLLRASVQQFMADVARDPATIREGARRGLAYLNLSGDAVDADAVPPDLVTLAVRLALRDADAERWDQALERLVGSQDSVVRRAILVGLASALDPALANRALDLTLDERVRLNETFRPLMTQAQQPELRANVWRWLGEHYEPLAERMGPGFAGYLPYVGSEQCTTEGADAVQAFFESRVGATEGGPRNLALSVEEVRLCAARVVHARESVAGAFPRR